MKIHLVCITNTFNNKQLAVKIKQNHSASTNDFSQQLSGFMAACVKMFSAMQPLLGVTHARPEKLAVERR